MQDNSNQNQTQPTASQPFASSTGPIDTPMPQNDLNDLNKLMSTQEPVTTPVTPSVPSIPVEVPTQPDLTAQVTQIPTENLSIDTASQPVVPTTAEPVVSPTMAPVQELPQDLPWQQTDAVQGIPAEPVGIAAEQTAAVPEVPVQQADTTFINNPTTSGVDASNLNVVDMMGATPATVGQPEQQPEPTTIEPTIPQEEFKPITPVTETVSPTAKAENLNILSDIIPTPIAEKPIPPVGAVGGLTNEPVIQAFSQPVGEPASQSVSEPAPLSVAPEGQLSQVFELTPSEVVIPSNSEPMMIQPEPAMVQMDMNATATAVKETVGPAVTKVTSSTNEETAKKSGTFGGFLRYAIWIFILLLGVVAIFLGVYLAGLVDIPFLDTIFGR